MTTFIYILSTQRICVLDNNQQRQQTRKSKTKGNNRCFRSFNYRLLLIKDTPSLEICYMSQFMRHRDLRWSADEYWCVCYMVNIQNFLPCNAFKTSFSTLIGSFIMTFLLRQLNLKAFFTYHPIRGCIQEAVDWFSLGIKRSLVVDFHSIIFVNYKTGVW